MKTIEEAERELESEISRVLADSSSALHSMIPSDYAPRVSLHGANRRKKRTASIQSWAPQSGEIRISFAQVARPEPQAQPRQVAASQPPESATRVGGAQTAPASSITGGPLAELVLALDRAEARPGLQFVALKWFRDAVLPAEGFAWARSESTRREVLSQAISGRLLLTSKVPNPKAPQFPVTAIRLNRMLPEVKVILGQPHPATDDFDPVAIAGENLSATVLRERR